MTGELVTVIQPQLYLWGLASLLLVVTAAAVIAPLRSESPLRIGCIWIPCGTIFTLALVFKFWLSDDVGTATPEDFLLAIAFGTI